MKVRFLVSMAGHSHTWDVNQIDDVPQDEAKRLIRAGYAVLAEAPPSRLPDAKRPPKKAVETTVGEKPAKETRKRTRGA